MRRSLALLAITGLLFSLSSCCRGKRTGLYDGVVAADLEIEDVRHELASIQFKQDDTRTELSFLEERVDEQQLVSQTQVELLHSQLTALQRKVQELEETQGRSLSDIRELGQYAKESAVTLHDVRSQQQKVERGLTADISHLKGAMQSICAADDSESSGLTYKVVSGDTLEKIARRYDTTVGALKKENNLTSDRIYAGQTLRLP